MNVDWSRLSKIVTEDEPINIIIKRRCCCNNQKLNGIDLIISSFVNRTRLTFKKMKMLYEAGR